MSMQPPGRSFGSASTANDFQASRIGRYPVQRHMFPPNDCSTSSLVGLGFFWRRLLNEYIKMSKSKAPLQISNILCLFSESY